MKNKLHFISFVFLSVLLNSCTPHQGGQGISSLVFFLIIIGLIIVVAVKSSNQQEDTYISSEQTNKVVNVTLTGGIIGLFASSPQSSLNNTIKRENANGWRVVQIIPADSGNIFLYIFRLLLLIITLFLFTTANGYYVIMEKK